jgi:predicted ester cyclase
MTANENKAIVRRLYEDGWGKGDLKAIEDIFAEEHIIHWNDLHPIDQHRTSDEVKQIITAYRNAFPDLQVIIEHIIAENDQVAVQVSFIGTHESEYEGFQPTKEKSRFTDMQMMKLQNGKIVESSLASGGLNYFYSIINGTIFNK